MQLRVGILTISDRVSRGEMEDLGGGAIEAELAADWVVAERGTVPDEADQISDRLRIWADEKRLDAILTTGGTGIGPRDVTPEATLAAASRVVPGIAEAIRLEGLRHTPHAMLSRGVAAALGDTLIINLPGSPSGAAEGARVVRPVLEHAVAIIHGGRH
ncbi:MAG: MogA/MoaB family molybdenum cofactor biosynthesis protein [Chloroflexota bacterium]